jgi:hypothetical protein
MAAEEVGKVGVQDWGRRGWRGKREKWEKWRAEDGGMAESNVGIVDSERASHATSSVSTREDEDS